MELLKSGGFSSLCIFHRGLGSDDEAAGVPERAERILYFYPRDVGISAQLKHVGFCEGLIDFVKTFTSPPDFTTQSLVLHKRRFAFLQAEKDVWMVLVLVNQQTAPPPSASSGQSSHYPQSTDTKAASATAAAVHAATSRRTALASAASNIEKEHYSSDNVSDALLFALMRRFYDTHCLFYGSVSRVVDDPHAKAFIARLLELRMRVRKSQNKKDNLVANYEAMLTRAAEAATASANAASAAHARANGIANAGGSPRAGEAEGGEEAAEEQSLVPAGNGAPSSEDLEALARQVHETADECDAAVTELLLLQRYSPVSALRATLRNVIDFCAHYTDWSHFSPYDGLDAIRCPSSLTKATWSAVQKVCTELELRHALVNQVAMLYDGYVVCGLSLPGLDVLYSYLRLHAFHILRGTYVPDRRPMDFTSVTAVPLHPSITLTAANNSNNNGGGRGVRSPAGAAGASKQQQPARAVATATNGGQSVSSSSSWSAALAAPQMRSLVSDFIQRVRLGAVPSSSAEPQQLQQASLVTVAKAMPSWLLLQCAGADRLLLNNNNSSNNAPSFPPSFNPSPAPTVPSAGAASAGAASSGPGAVGVGVGMGIGPIGPMGPMGGMGGIGPMGGGGLEPVNTARSSASSASAGSGSLSSTASSSVYSPPPSPRFGPNNPMPPSLNEEIVRRLVDGVTSTPAVPSLPSAAGAATATITTVTTPGYRSPNPVATSQQQQLQQRQLQHPMSPSAAGVLPAAMQPPAPAPSVQSFYRGPKPATLAVPALPAAAAARRCLKSAVTVEADWPVIDLPYVAQDFLTSLQQLLPVETQEALLTEASRAREQARALRKPQASGAASAPTPVLTAAAAPGAAGSEAASSSSSSSLLTLKRKNSRSPSDAVIVSTSAIGPPLARRIILPPGATLPPGMAPTGPGTSIIRTGGSSRAGQPQNPQQQGQQQIIAPIVLDDTQLIFCPPLFALNPHASMPSHRLVWYQQGLITLLCYVDANALTAADKGAAQAIQRAASAAAAAAAAAAGAASPSLQGAAAATASGALAIGPLSSSPSGMALSIGPPALPSLAAPSSSSPSMVAAAQSPGRRSIISNNNGALVNTTIQHLDVPPQPLQDLAARIREMGSAFIPGVETALSESVDFSAAQAASSGLEAVKHAHADVVDGVLQVHGYSTVARRPGKGRDATGAPVSQAAPILSTALESEVPRHLNLHLLAGKDALLQPLEAMGAPRLPFQMPGPSSYYHGTNNSNSNNQGNGSNGDPLFHPLTPAMVGAGANGGAAAILSSPAARRRTLGPAPPQDLPCHPLSPGFVAGHAPSFVGNVMMAGMRSAAVAHESRKIWRRRDRKRALSAGTMSPEEPSSRSNSVGVGGYPMGRDITALRLPHPPVIEEHLLATRYDGGVAVRRVGGQDTFTVFDGRTPPITEVQAKVEELSQRHGTDVTAAVAAAAATMMTERVANSNPNPAPTPVVLALPPQPLPGMPIAISPPKLPTAAAPAGGGVTAGRRY